MEAEKAGYPIALMARVLGVTRAGFYAWGARGARRRARAAGRRELDRLVAWELTRFQPGLRCWQDHCRAASLRGAGGGLGCGGLDEASGLVGGEPVSSAGLRVRSGRLMIMRTAVGVSGTRARLTRCGSRASPICVAVRGGCTCVPCGTLTRGVCWGGR